MAHSNPAFSLAISDEKEYFFRICNLLVDGGTKIMKLEFDKIHPPNTLATVMQNERHTLHGLVGRRILTQKMWNELFPTVNASVDSNNFDITLLSVLFRNICGLTPPPSSSVHNYWDTYPQQNDITLQADLVRLKLLRNEIVAHASTTSISKAEFEKLWKDISSILLRRGGPSWKQEINQLLKTPFTNFGKSCLEQLKAWDENDKDLLEITLATSQKVDVIKSDMELIKSVIEKGQQNKPDVCWGRLIAKWWHQASGVERAAAVAVCGFCGYSTVKELGSLLLTSKDKLVNILTPVFGHYHLTLSALKPNCIKLFLKAGSFDEFRHWLMKTKDNSFQRELCFAMEEASNQFEEFHNTRVPFNPEHFHLVVFSLDGTEINSKNLAKYTNKVAEQGCKDFLLKSAIIGNLDNVETAIRSGVDINTTDSNGETALHKASSQGHYHMVDWLLRGGAKIDLVDNDGETALHKACKVQSSYCYYVVHYLLLEHGAEIDLVDKDGETALHKACKVQSPYSYDVVCFLLKHGAEIDLVDKEQMLPLAVSAQVKT